MTRVESGPRLTRRQLLTAIGSAALTAATSELLGCASPTGAQAPKPEVVPAVQPTLAPKPTEVVPATFTPKVDNTPTDTPLPSTATATSTPSPTETSQPTATATATATREASPTPKPEIPWSPGAVFYGNAVDKDGKKVAEMFRSRTSDEILSYWITVPDKDGIRTRSWGNSKPINVKGTHYEIGGTINVWEKADYNEQKKTIVGIMFELDSKDGSTFELNYVGEGKQVMLATIARIMRNLSSDQPKDDLTETGLKRYIEDNFP